MPLDGRCTAFYASLGLGSAKDPPTIRASWTVSTTYMVPEDLDVGFPVPSEFFVHCECRCIKKGCRRLRFDSGYATRHAVFFPLTKCTFKAL